MTAVICLKRARMWLTSGCYGKSFVSLLLGVQVALGLLFVGLATTRSDVLFLVAADGAHVLRQRLAKICRALSINKASIEGNLHLLDASDLGPALHREQRGKGIMETPLLSALATVVQQLDVGLVVVDNISDAFDGNEIDRVQVRGFIRSLRSQIARPGRAVLLLAYINKESAARGATPAQRTTRARPPGTAPCALDCRWCRLGLTA